MTRIILINIFLANLTVYKIDNLKNVKTNTYEHININVKYHQS